MTATRLKAGLWVRGLIRGCAGRGVTAVVARRGDEDAGAVLVKVNRFAGGCLVYAQAYGTDGARTWLPALGEAPVPDAEAEAYIGRAGARDPDLWVVEIEDPTGAYVFTDPAG